MHRDTVKLVTQVFLAVSLAVPVAGAQSDRDFRWTGAVSSGRWMYVRNLNGTIRVERGTGSAVEVTAEKRWRRGDPEDVRIEVTRVGSGDQDVVVCAVWRDHTDQCDERGYRTSGNRRNRWDRDDDVTVDFTVRVPDGVRIDVSSVNGRLDIAGASSEVEAHTVNGGISAQSTGGPVRASTVNGDIDVRMATVGREDLHFETVNGSIDVTVPDNLNATVTMRTVNGSVGSDFPMTLNGRVNPRRITAQIGSGGPRLEFSTVNGSIDLRRG
jgi:hypothetical protein